MSKSFPQKDKRGRRNSDHEEVRGSRVNFKRYLQDLKKREAEEEMDLTEDDGE
jgi:hypothetical protein